MKQNTTGDYDNSTSIELQSECTECGKNSIPCMNYIAEHNAGELYTISLCKDCLAEGLGLLTSDRVMMRSQPYRRLRSTFDMLERAIKAEDKSLLLSGIKDLEERLTEFLPKY